MRYQQLFPQPLLLLHCWDQGVSSVLLLSVQRGKLPAAGLPLPVVCSTVMAHYSCIPMGIFNKTLVRWCARKHQLQQASSFIFAVLKALMYRTNDSLGYSCSAFPPSFLKMHGTVFRSLHCLCKRDLQNQSLGKSMLKGINPRAALEPGSVQTILVIACRKGV